jgi:lantibiotic modifying enzyme
VADEIAAALESSLDGLRERGFSLANGLAGIALFFSYLAGVSGERCQRLIAQRLIADAVDALAAVRMPAGFYEGFSGIVWAARHLAMSDEQQAEDFGEIDRVLRDHLGRTPWREPYDLIGGLAGYGVYALNRLPGALAWECLSRVIDRLQETAERDSEGARWFTPPELIPPHQLERCPQGYYNLGLAHGIPGPIAVLAAACRTAAHDRARPILGEAVRWLLAQRLGASAGGGMPGWVCEEEQPRRTRLAWCYGDPGVAAVLIVAAGASGEVAWERAAVELARGAANRSVDEAGVIDSGLCHGYAGLGHVFNRLWQQTGDAELERAARSWIELALDTRQPGTGTAGLWAMLPDADGNLRPHGDPGFLTGAAGVGLALLAAVGDLEPTWDRCLLLSPPGGG